MITSGCVLQETVIFLETYPLTFLYMMEKLCFCFWLQSEIRITKNRFLCMSVFKQQEKANAHAITIYIIFPIAQLSKTKTDNSKKPRH